MIKLKEKGAFKKTQLACFKVPRDEEELYELVKDSYEMNYPRHIHRGIERKKCY